MRTDLLMTEALVKAQQHKKQCSVPSAVQSKLPGFTNFVISSYHKKLQHGKRAVVGFLFFQPVIEKHKYMLPGDEISSKPLVAIRVNTPNLRAFTQLIKNIQQNHFEKLQNVLNSIQHQQSEMVVANINL